MKIGQGSHRGLVPRRGSREVRSEGRGQEQREAAEAAGVVGPGAAARTLSQQGRKVQVIPRAMATELSSEATSVVLGEELPRSGHGGKSWKGRVWPAVQKWVQKA